MGHVFSLPIHSMVVQYLRTLKRPTNDTVYYIKNFQTEIQLNKYDDSEEAPAPKCKLSINNATIRISNDLWIDGHPLSARSSQVSIVMGQALVECEELGYCFRVTGRIIFYDVVVSLLLTPKFDRGIQIANVYSETEVGEIKSELVLHINDVSHTKLLNALLNITAPYLAGNLIDAIFLLLKENIADWMNDNIEGFLRRCGLG